MMTGEPEMVSVQEVADDLQLSVFLDEVGVIVVQALEGAIIRRFSIVDAVDLALPEATDSRGTSLMWAALLEWCAMKIREAAQKD